MHDPYAAAPGSFLGVLQSLQEQVNALSAKLDAAPAPASSQSSPPADPAAPYRAMWENGYPLTPGEEIPAGVYLVGRGDGSIVAETTALVIVDDELAATYRAKDPLPEPEWYSAPAVVATDDRDRRTIFFPVPDRAEYWQSAQTGLHFHRSELTDVIALFPRS